MTKLLAIESSCDETSVAIIEDGRVLANLTANQDIHAEYGGVVPELASRAHQQNIVPVTLAALKQANVQLNQMDAVAITLGPGLMGALLVGVSYAKSLAFSLQKPLITVNHMEAHILAHFIEPPFPGFPFICLTVSGGHTQLVLVKHYLDMEVIGETRDDAVGEAFDKAGKLFGLGYPAGPRIDTLAQQGDPKAVLFPEAQIPNLDFSFSGIKTAVMYHLRDEQRKNPEYIHQNLPNLCASLQSTLISTLLKKLQKAAKQFGIKEIAIAGGVSANSGLRKALVETGEILHWKTYIPKFEYCTDNAAMIGVAGYYKYLAHQFARLDVTPDPRMKITRLSKHNTSS